MLHFLRQPFWSFCIYYLLLAIGSKTSPETYAAALENFTVIDFLQDTKRLHSFENVLIVRNQNATLAKTFISCSNTGTDNIAADVLQFVSAVMSVLHVPVLQMNEFTTLALKQHFSELLMSVVFIDGTSLSNHSDLLRRLVLNLRHMTTSKVLFLINYNGVSELLLVELFRLCWQYKLLNVVALFADYQETATYYSYTHFPTFAVETKTIAVDVISRREVYPYRMGNLKGAKFDLILGGSEPRIIVYIARNGEKIIGGFVGHFLQAFAKKYNCILTEPMPTKLNAFAPAQDLIAAVRNGTVEISAALTFPSIPISGYTYPYEQMNWCVVMPVEPDVPDYRFFVFVFETSAFLITLAFIVLISMVLSSALYSHGYKLHLLDVILHRDCLRGILGQSFTEVANPPKIVRFIYLQICILGILLTTTYNSYFATYVTTAPKEAPLRTFDDILQSSIKVLAFTPEYNELLGRAVEFFKYTPLFYLENDFKTYLEMRDSFNTKYGYMMPTTKWTTVTEQQKVFTTPMFSKRDSLCFFNNIPMCLPVHENSIYMQTLYQLMLETAQSGLTNFWRQNGFYELISAGRLSFTDMSRKKEFEEMVVDDLRYIWIGLGVMLVLVTLVFFLELCVYNRRKIYGILKSSFLKLRVKCADRIVRKNR